MNVELTEHRTPDVQRWTSNNDVAPLRNLIPFFFQKSNVKPGMTISVSFHLFQFNIRRWTFDVRCSFFFGIPPAAAHQLWLLSSDLCLPHFNEALCPNSIPPSFSSSSLLWEAVRSNRQKGHIRLCTALFYGRANPASSLDRSSNPDRGGSPRPAHPWGLKKLYSVGHLRQVFSPHTGANFPQ